MEILACIPHYNFYFFSVGRTRIRKHNDTAMITATTWVPKGFAAQFPKRVDVTEEEFERIADLARLQLEDAQEDLDDARAEAGEDGDEEDRSKEKKKAMKAAAQLKDTEENEKDKEE